MAEARRRHRLDGLEPDNLLAFLALLGLLRALEAARPEWRPRAAWDLEEPPLRPVLVVAERVSQEAICEATAAGIETLVASLDFGPATDLKLSREQARELLGRTVSQGFNDASRYFSELCAALLCDAALNRDLSKAAPTPLAFDTVARINFLDALKTLSTAALPEKRRRDPKYPRSAAECIAQALFGRWDRLDRPSGLRWDPDEAKRHAYQWNAPTDEKPTTQHGANRLAIVGLPALTCAPTISRNRVQLSTIGGEGGGDRFTFAWPIWRMPISLAAIRALLSDPKLRQPQALDHLGVDHVRLTRRIALGRYKNFTRAEPLDVKSGAS